MFTMFIEELIVCILFDILFFSRYLYIKTQFYKTKGIANGNSNQYFSDFVFEDKEGYVVSVPKNIFSLEQIKGYSYTIWIKKKDPYKAVMGIEPFIYLVLGILDFVFIVTFLVMLIEYTA